MPGSDFSVASISLVASAFEHDLPKSGIRSCSFLL
jgi:hypothetical protein